jgi:hypothetical protein
MGFLLFVIAYVLFLPLTVINYLAVKNKKGYFKSSAISLDRFGNREFRTLFNKTLITANGHQFGDMKETISGVLGKNERDNTLSKTGKILVWILDKLDKNHALKSIDK